MNSLQIGLIGIGVFVIAVLALWSWWQLRRGNTERAKSPSNNASAIQNEPVLSNKSGGRDGRADPIEPVVHFADTASPTAQESPRANHAWARDLRSQAPETQPLVSPNSPPVLSELPESDSQDRDFPRDIEAQTLSTEAAFDAPSTAAKAIHAPTSATAKAPSAATPSIMPFDERLHVCAVLSRDDRQPFDVLPFLRIAGRASVWGRLFRQSPWEGVDLSQPTGAVISLCLALPIASRGGPVTEAEFDAWRNSVAVECAAQNVSVQFEGFTAAAARAEELDSFLAAVDCIPITYLVRKDGEAWSGTRLRGTLEANGFRLQSDGRFAYHEVETEQVIFYAIDGYERAFTPERLRTESVAAFRLVMEAARLTQPLHRFDAYRQTLRALAKLMDAELRDSSGASVGEPEFAAMRSQVLSASEALVAAGIAPGSPSALALFT